MSLHSSPELGWIEAKEAANTVVFQSSGQYLNDLEIKILQGAWESKTYDEIAQLYDYSAEYLNKDVGNKLWKKLGSPVIPVVDTICSA